MKSIKIFTDGAVPNNQNKGNRTGGIGVFFGVDDDRNISQQLKETKKMKVTNQICELTACIEGLKTLLMTQIIDKKIKVYTDSMYVVNIVKSWAKKWEKNKWKKGDNTKIQNLDLIKKLYYLSLNLHISIKHVKAHTKKPSETSTRYKKWYGNYMADKLASLGAKS